MTKTKLMWLSDSPASSSGLGRITREVAQRIVANLGDEIELCTFSYGGGVSRKLPWQQYEMKVNDLVPINLPQCWEDFAEGQRGVLAACWNPSWTPWLADPERCTDEGLKKFLRTKPFSRWAYLPIDSDTLPGRLPDNLTRCIYQFDRIATYTEWAKGLIENSRPKDVAPKEIAALPHGLDTTVFYPRDRKVARDTFVNRVAGLKQNPVRDDVVLVGVVATSTPRKDWYLAFEVCAELVRRGVNVGLWVHADAMRKNWDIPALAKEFGMTDRTIASNRVLQDDDLAWAYAACDVTLGIGSGEGWGLPLAESLAMGIPVIHGNYAGGAEFVPEGMKVEPYAFRGDGFFAARRPVFRASDWADAVQVWLGPHGDVVLPSYIEWPNAWDSWAKWLRAGLADLNANSADQVAGTFGAKL
jgi:glycosyltransferase involved in cell wall biosynthesis